MTIPNSFEIKRNRQIETFIFYKNEKFSHTTYIVIFLIFEIESDIFYVLLWPWNILLTLVSRQL
jgi:hypothetical protein